MKLELKYVITLNSYAPTNPLDRPKVSAITRGLNLADYTRCGSAYVHRDDLDSFLSEAYKTYSNISVIN